MTAKKNTAPVDPLAGIPQGTVGKLKTAPAPTAAPVTAPGVINLAAARKRRKLTGQAFKDAQKFARDMVGYDSSSPIWGRRLVDVIQDIEAKLDGGSVDEVSDARDLVIEIKKRLAYGQIMKAQS